MRSVLVAASALAIDPTNRGRIDRLPGESCPVFRKRNIPGRTELARLMLALPTASRTTLPSAANSQSAGWRGQADEED